MYYPTTKGLTTSKLRHPNQNQKNSIAYLLFTIIVLSAICLFYQNLIVDIVESNKKIDMKHETADELYINAETCKTKELLRQELEKTK